MKDVEEEEPTARSACPHTILPLDHIRQNALPCPDRILLLLAQALCRRQPDQRLPSCSCSSPCPLRSVLRPGEEGKGDGGGGETKNRLRDVLRLHVADKLAVYQLNPLAREERAMAGALRASSGSDGEQRRGEGGGRGRRRKRGKEEEGEGSKSGEEVEDEGMWGEERRGRSSHGRSNSGDDEEGVSFRLCEVDSDACLGAWWPGSPGME